MRWLPTIVLLGAGACLAQEKVASVRLGAETRAIRYDAVCQDTASGPAPAGSLARPALSRSKWRIVAGSALIGAGVALIVANPDLTTQYLLDSRGNLYKQGYRVRVVGGVTAGGGGALLLTGLRKR